jgi:tetratricopeptide (TPR) repeat protein
VASSASARGRLEAQTKEIEAMHRAGRMTNEQYGKKLEDLKREQASLSFTALRVGGENSPWQKTISFYVRADKSWYPLPWPLERYYSYPDSPVAILDLENSAVAEFGLNPSEVEKLSKGDYVIKAAVDVPLEGSRTHAKIESNSVSVRVTGSREEMKEDRLRNLCYYYLRRGRYDMVTQQAKRMIELDSKSIAGYALLGEAEEAKGNLKEALEAYTRAEKEFRTQYPNSYQQPVLIMRKIIKIRAKLGLVPKGQ